MTNYNFDSAVRSAMRRSFARSPKVINKINEGKRKVPHYNADGTRSKVDRVELHCEVCDRWLPSKLFSGVDHIEPVVEMTGFRDWNTFVSRLNCDPSNLQRICEECHQKKSNIERMTRLRLSYTQELDIIESNLFSGNDKDTLKRLTVLASKHKFVELADMADRAKNLKARLKLQKL